MPKPANKEELIALAGLKFNELPDFINGLPEDVKNRTYKNNELVSVHNVDTLWTDYLKNSIFVAFRRENARSVYKVTDFVNRHELNDRDKTIADHYNWALKTIKPFNEGIRC